MQCCYAIFGQRACYADEFKASEGDVRMQVLAINKHLAGKSFLVGDSVTMADIFLAGALSFAFQTFLDGGFQKGIKNLITWFEKVCKMEAFQTGFGNIRMTQ